MEKLEKEALAFRLRTLLSTPGEDGEVDYKASFVFSEKGAQSLKLARHILGMSNAGGGYLVIGFKQEDGTFRLDETHSAEAQASFDTTRLSQFIGSITRGDECPQVTIYPVEFGGRTIPVIRVEEFAREPYFCKSTKPALPEEPILKSGALYFRDKAAKTVEIASPEHFKLLIDRAIAKRRSEFLDEFKTMLEVLQTGRRHPSKPDYWEDFQGIISRERTSCLNSLASRSNETRYIRSLQLYHAPLGSIGPARDLRDLLAAMQAAVRHKSSFPIGSTHLGKWGKAAAELDGVRMHYDLRETGDSLFANVFQWWFLHEGLGFFLIRNANMSASDEAALLFDALFTDILEALDHCVVLYETLGLPLDTQMRVECQLNGINGMCLAPSDYLRNRGVFVSPKKAESGQAIAVWQGALAELRSEDFRITTTLVNKLLQQFEFFAIDEGLSRLLYQNYRNIHVG